ncbi:hypothetical protein WN50_04095 [Limnoraphis robusta CS-951]|uniref:Uncharacterized protein n=1 Tax=Limnoraphis robusta CS-951 TaxID=1637645 RepID=A0A0F5YMB1_9CYAN|nr:hypothetical protein WN50_04095 [Limnoraphis robusta CS-951]
MRILGILKIGNVHPIKGIALRAGNRQEAKAQTCDSAVSGESKVCKKGKSKTRKDFQLLKKFGGTETDTATAVALLGGTPRPHCLNFSLLPMS